EKREIENQRAARSKAPPLTVDELADLRRADIAYRRAELVGRIDDDTTLVFAHRFHRHHPGAWIARPLQLRKGGTIVVNLGWVPHGRSADIAQSLDTPDRQRWSVVLHRLRRNVRDSERRRSLKDRGDKLSGDTTQWDTMDLEAVYRHLRGPVPAEPVFGAATESVGSGRFPVASGDFAPAPFLTSGRHLSYALFWYAMAVALAGIWLAAGFSVLESRRRGRPRDGPEQS
ncbi:MAG: SURF1 family protein, partial [Bradymonadaceae bacterium]